jgi:hypothetical protein
VEMRAQRFDLSYRHTKSLSIFLLFLSSFVVPPLTIQAPASVEIAVVQQREY